MVQVLSIEEAKRGTSQVRVEMSNGEVFIIGFLSTMPLEAKADYSKNISILLETFEAIGETDMFNYLSSRMVRSNMEMPFYIMPDRNDERTRIGNRIKELREDRKIEAKRLAQLTDIDAANICRIEQGKYSAGLDILCKIATALDAKVEIIPNKATSEGLPILRRPWIVPSNIHVFDIRSCIVEYGYCYWQQYNNFQIGDVIYIYATKPDQEVCFRFIVCDVDLLYSDEIAKQQKFWKSKEGADKGIENDRYAKFKYAGSMTGGFTLEKLIEKGYLKAAPQGAMMISEELRRFLEGK